MDKAIHCIPLLKISSRQFELYNVRFLLRIVPCRRWRRAIQVQAMSERFLEAEQPLGSHRDVIQKRRGRTIDFEKNLSICVFITLYSPV